MKKFVVVAFDPEDWIIVIYVATLASFSFNVYLSCQAHIASLKADEIFPVILDKYADFTNIFLPDLATKLLEYTGIKDYVIDLISSN